MDVAKLLNLITEMPAYRQLLDELQHTASTGVLVLDAAKPYFIAAIYQSLQVPMMAVTAQPERSKRLYEQLSAWSNAKEIKLLPEPDALPYERAISDAATDQERVQALSALANINGEQNPPLVVASAAAIMPKTVPYSDFAAASHTIKPGMTLDPLKLLEKWQALGYRLENLVEMPGTMSRRGGIIDLYPPTSELPLRLDFFGNTAESIRSFDPASQRSLAPLSSVAIGPATEQLTTPKDSIFSYIRPPCLLVLDEPQLIRQAMEELDTEARELRTEKIQRGELPANSPIPYFTWKELEPKIKEKPNLMLTALGIGEPAYRLSFTTTPSYGGQLPAFVNRVKQLLKQKQRLIIVSHQASRLSELLEQEDIIASPTTEIKQMPAPGSITLVQGLLAEGWVLNNETTLFTDAEIFGFIKQRRLVKRRPVPHQRLEFAPGDYVVHVEHGIAKFGGVTRLSTDGSEREYLWLQYAAGDKLYVPSDQIDRLSRYIGASDRTPVLNRLGTQEWTRTRQQAKEAAEDVARELLALYASREVIPGFAFSPDSVWQQELEASFPYVETPDQMKVQEEVKNDMEKTRPMDRLVCGDVGYGKTEVAVRAAFKAVMDGKQVAVLVPTTVLAQQHFATFSQRLDAFPIRVAVLSRFKTEKEQETTIKGLADGSVDICIGTHRLLQKDVVFKNLGLLIIDEEQRFGVAHKEHLKKMRQEVDVLTLSATPIPRTLHMSLAGVRDMSTMETPPEQRLPIKTYIAEYNEHLIREAILREMERNGQVFFVHNRVQGIAYVAGKLKELVPETRIAIAHGQMPEAELEAVMADFARGNSDVLVCTTIIESGLDMPNVNTLIVNRADRFGLTQLYQLRGRVGRGANLAYAYFLYSKGKRLTPNAEKRLRTIFEATELGAGFGIAMRDLEIRGAGTLLGQRQSGHITAVGFNLYTRLLAEAVEELKAKQAGVAAPKPSHLPPPTLDLPLRAYIPEEYVADLDTRLSLYQSLARLDRIEQVEAMAEEFSDRFGAPPAEVQNLLYAIKVKILAAKAGIESISTEEGQIILRLFEGMKFTPHQREIPLPDGVRMGTSQIILNPKRLGKEWQGVLEGVLGNIT
jgi:transcription-repair coupling factor (superfamily II helicase)